MKHKSLTTEAEKKILEEFRRVAKDDQLFAEYLNQFEKKIAEHEAFWIDGLKAARMDQSRRPLQVMAEGLQWHWEDSESLAIAFSLPSGSYATSLLRELCVTIKPD